MKYIKAIVLLSVFFSFVFAEESCDPQTVTFNGSFLSKITGKPLAGAKIVVRAVVFVRERSLTPGGNNYTYYAGVIFPKVVPANGVVNFQYTITTCEGPYWGGGGDGEPSYQYEIRRSFTRWEVEIPGFATPTISGNTYLTQLNVGLPPTTNVITVGLKQAAMNKTMSEAFYANKMNFHKDLIQNNTGWELGAPYIYSLTTGSVVCRIPIYKAIAGIPVTSYVQITGDIGSLKSWTGGFPDVGMRVNGIGLVGPFVPAGVISNEAQETGTIFQAFGAVSFFVSLGFSSGVFSASSDQYTTTYNETEFLEGSVSGDILKLKFQTKFQYNSN